MVLIDKLTKRKVYRYLLSEGVIVIKKDYSLTPHKDTEVPNLYVWMLLRSLKSRDYVECVYNWQFNYFFLNAEGKKYLNEFLGITEQVQPYTWKNDETRQYEIRDENNKRAFRGPRGDRPEGGRDGGRGGRGRPRKEEGAGQKVETPAEKPQQVPAA